MLGYNEEDGFARVNSFILSEEDADRMIEEMDNFGFNSSDIMKKREGDGFSVYVDKEVVD